MAAGVYRYKMNDGWFWLDVTHNIESVQEKLNALYPEGVPFDTKNILGADLSRITDALGKVQTAVIASKLLESATRKKGEASASDALDVLSNILALSSAVTSATPGVGKILDFYDKSLDAIKEKIIDIKDTYDEADVSNFEQLDCGSLDAAPSRGNLMKTISRRLK